MAAAGNSGGSSKIYPAGFALDNVLAVAATDPSDNLASFSTFGTWVHLAAPGVHILSTRPGGAYGYSDGTSMATPHVSGSAAMVRERFSTFTALDIKNRLMQTVDTLASLSGKVQAGGRLNLLRALGGTETPDTDTNAPTTVTDLTVNLPATTMNSITVYWSAPSDAKGDGTTGPAYFYNVRYLAGQPITPDNWASAVRADDEPLPGPPGMTDSFTIPNLQPATTYYIALTSMDESGNLSGISNVVSETTTAPPPGSWAPQTVASTGTVGFYNSLAYDASGSPGIGFSDQTTGEVKFAQWNGLSWTITTVGAGTEGISASYDPADGRASLSFIQGGTLKFAHFNGASWQVETVAKNLNTDVTSLQFGPSGNPAITFVTKGGSLKLARKTGSTWTIETVTNARARYSSLAHDSLGNPSVAFSDDVDNDNFLDTLKFARWNGSAWVVETVESGIVGGIFASLAYDPNGNPTVAYRFDPSSSNQLVRFARKTGSTWTIETVDTGTGVSLAYDSTGAPLIGYFIYSTQVKAARWNGASWEIEVVNNISSSWRTSIAGALSGERGISYYNSSNADLKFARK